MLPFSFQKGNKAAGCEDAPPVAEVSYSIVCDGLGGSGSTKHQVIENGLTVMRTSGYLGSRIVCDSVKNYYSLNQKLISKIITPTADECGEIASIVCGLKECIRENLERKMRELEIDPLLTRKKALKIFPTTLASALYFNDGKKVRILAIWAGDSRVYVLTPSKGLQMLTLDDAINADVEMKSASEMNNCISAGNPFRLNYSVYEINEPGIIFCCSDGCFDYLPSPLHFEWLVLQTILSCIPNVTSDYLGEAFACSIRDTVYQSIGDDTTMAGVICKVDSTEELRKAFSIRMEQFGKLALQMNDALKIQKAYQNEKDSAAKKCRLFEEKVIADLRASIIKTLTNKAPIILYSYLSALPCFADYQDIIIAIDKHVDAECEAELEALNMQLNEQRRICIEMILRDYLRWRSIKQDSSVSSSSFVDFFTPRTRGISKKSNSYLKPSSVVQPLKACIQLFGLSDFRSLGIEETLSDTDIGEFIQSQIKSIEALILIMENDNPLFEDLWSQAYFSTDRFERERQEIAYSQDFSLIINDSLNDPASCNYLSELTYQKIASYKIMNNNICVIQHKYAVERERRKAVAPEEFYLKNEKELLDSIFRMTVDTLDNLFKGTNVSMERLAAYIEARKVILENDDKLKIAKESVQGIWNRYSLDYQLFKQITEKGVV